MVIICGGVLAAEKALWKNNAGPVRHDDLTMIVLPPPPPPVPTPKPVATPQQLPTPEEQVEKMVEQQPVHQDEKRPETSKEKLPDAPAPLGTSITGPGGGSDLGLGAGLGGGFGSGLGGGGGSKFGWYASEVQNSVVNAVRNNPRTQGAAMDVIICIWPDSSGRVVKARVVNSSGNRALDAVLKNQVMTGLQLSEPPPPDMPLPIVVHLSSRLPG